MLLCYIFTAQAVFSYFGCVSFPQSLFFHLPVKGAKCVGGSRYVRPVPTHLTKVLQPARELLLQYMTPHRLPTHYTVATIVFANRHDGKWSLQQFLPSATCAPVRDFWCHVWSSVKTCIQDCVSFFTCPLLLSFFVYPSLLLSFAFYLLHPECSLFPPLLLQAFRL